MRTQRNCIQSLGVRKGKNRKSITEISGKKGQCGTNLVRTSSLHLLMIHDSSKSTGNQPLTHTLSASGTPPSSPLCSLNIWDDVTQSNRLNERYKACILSVDLTN